MSCFNGCSELESIPADLFKNSGAQGVVYGKRGAGMNMIFQGCSSLKKIPAGILDGFTRITALNNIFNGCSSLESIPSDLFKDAAAVTSFSSAFSGCTALKSIPAGVFKGLAKVTSFAGVFQGCTESQKSETTSLKVVTQTKTSPICSKVVSVWQKLRKTLSKVAGK